MNKSNIALIGMAGVGKSFIGKHLADKLGYGYIEVDGLITMEANNLGVKKDTLADDDFMTLEEKVMLELGGKNNSVFDTGGSVIYSKLAMDFLKSSSSIVYLKDSVENIAKRFDERGEPHLVGIAGKTFGELLGERTALYEKYADFMVDVSDHKDVKDILNKIITSIDQA